MQPLVLIRHAESRHHVDGLTGGWTDTELTELGVRQAHLLAQRLQEDLKHATYRLCCSDLKRTLQTADIVGEALGIVPEPIFELREIHIGDATNKTKDAAEEIKIPFVHPLMDWRPFENAESFGELYHRSAKIMSDLISDTEDMLILVVHSENLNMIAQWYLGLGPDQVTNYDALHTEFNVDPASITFLKDSPDWHAREIRCLNDTTHLYAAGLAKPIHFGSS